MGLAAPDQPPEILWPLEGARDVTPDACAWGRGGTMAPDLDGRLAERWTFEHAGGRIAGRHEPIGHDESYGPHGLETIAMCRVRPETPLPERAAICLVHHDPARGPTVLLRFETGSASEPASAASPRRVEVPAPTPGVPSFAPPRPGPTAVMHGFALELAPGPHVVITRGRASLTRIALGPGPWIDHVEADASGHAEIRVLDASLRERLAFAIP